MATQGSEDTLAGDGAHLVSHASAIDTVASDTVAEHDREKLREKALEARRKLREARSKLRDAKISAIDRGAIWLAATRKLKKVTICRIARILFCSERCMCFP